MFFDHVVNSAIILTQYGGENTLDSLFLLLGLGLHFINVLVILKNDFDDIFVFLLY